MASQGRACGTPGGLPLLQLSHASGLRQGRSGREGEQVECRVVGGVSCLEVLLCGSVCAASPPSGGQGSAGPPKAVGGQAYCDVWTPETHRCQLSPWEQIWENFLLPREETKKS